VLLSLYRQACCLPPDRSIISGSFFNDKPLIARWHQLTHKLQPLRRQQRPLHAAAALRSELEKHAQCNGRLYVEHAPLQAAKQAGQ
jgi:hypothetical protein